MNQEQWTAVDQYINDHLVGTDAALDAALAASAEAGLPAINVAPNQGKLLQLLARSIGARRILEIGTLGGYSTIWMARALPHGGRLVTLEMDPKHARVASENFRNAALDHVIDVRIGRALKTLPELVAEGVEPFDFVFIDADKQSIPEYMNWSLSLTHVGSVIVVDNVVRNGAVIDAGTTDPMVIGVRRLNTMLSKDKRVSATTLQTVGSKGYDGLTIAYVLATSSPPAVSP